MTKKLLVLIVILIGSLQVSKALSLNYPADKLMKSYKDDIANGFYIKLGFVQPNGFYFGPRPKSGGVFQMGLNLYFNKRGIADRLHFGMNIDIIGLAVNPQSGGAFMNLSLLRLGPLMSVSIVPKVAFDVYFNVVPTMLIDNRDTYLGYGLGLGYAFGAQFRFKIVTIGFESTFGELRAYDEDFKKTIGRVSSSSFRVLLGLFISN